MILLGLIAIPAAGGLAAWLANRFSVRLGRWTALAAMAAQLALVAWIWAADSSLWQPGASEPLRFGALWIPTLGINFLLAMDGLSLVLVALTGAMGILAVAASWRSVSRWEGFFHFNLLWSLAAITGLFLAEDLLLLYFFWEMMLVPLYLLIRIWGHEDRVRAATKFFLFTQAGGLLLLLGILGLYFLHGRDTGLYTFNFADLVGTEPSPAAAWWLMLAFFAAFAVKLPAFGVHTWLADAHTQAPVAGSVDLAGLVLKVGAYGMLRFVIPLFPREAMDIAPFAMALGVAGILYGALLASVQTDLKRLVAYTSVSHMGFVLLGIFSWDTLAIQGTILVIVSHGLSTGALFVLVGMLHERLGTHDVGRMGGLWQAVPRLGGAAMFLALATLGLPGMGNFVGEWLVLQGTWRASRPVAAVAAVGFVLSTIYSLRMIQLVFFGRRAGQEEPPDTTARESAMMVAAMVLLLWLGLYPRPFLRAVGPAVTTLRDDSLRRAQRSRLVPAPPRPPAGQGGVP